MAASLLNFILFQASWFAAIFGGAAGHALAGAVPGAIAAAVHLALFRGTKLREGGVVLAITLLGIAVETAFMAGGIITYAGTAAGQILPPVWIIAMWTAFGTLPNASLNWLSHRWALQVVLGAVLGPSSYLAGARLGAATLPDPAFSSLAAIGLGWALALPVIFLLAETINGKTNAQART